jgi:opacity protein-like surface antigen
MSQKTSRGCGLPAAVMSLVLICSSTLSAQSREVWVSSGTTNFGFPYFHANRELGSASKAGGPGNTQIDNGWRIGFRIAFNSSGPFGHEFQYSYSRPKFIDNKGNVLGTVGSDKMEIHQAGYNFLYYFSPRESAVRPLATVGVHVNDFVLPGSASTSQDSDTKWGFNYGVGLKWRITPLLAVRGDLRAYESGKPNWGGTFFNQGGLQHQIEASAGLGIYF